MPLNAVNRTLPMRLLFALPLLLCLTSPADALPSGAGFEADARAFAAARAADAAAVLLGPAVPVTPTIEPALDCNALYLRRMALTRQQLDYHTSYLDDPRNQTALAVGTVTTWGFAYLPFTAMQSYTRSARKGQIEAELDALRQASARLQCFRR